MDIKAGGLKVERIESHPDGRWGLVAECVEIKATASSFEVVGRKSLGMSMAFDAAEGEWILKKDGGEICRVPGSAPPKSLDAMIASPVEAPSFDTWGSARGLIGLASLPAREPGELRRQASLGVAHGDPYTVFCALASGADLSTPMEGYVRHPVSEALDRRSNEQGHARLRRSLGEVRGWLDMLGAFGGSLDHRDRNGRREEGGLDRYTVGQSAAWGADEARQAALERGVDFAPPLSLMMESSYLPENRARAMSLLLFLAESGDDKAARAMREAGDPLFAKRDKDRSKGNDVICSMDDIAAALLARGHCAAFASACAMEPRIDRGFAFGRGLGEWMERARFEPCKGPRGAAKLKNGLRAAMEAASVAGLGPGAAGVEFGRVLAGSSSKPAALMEGKQSGGLAALDLGFLGAKNVAKGALAASSSIPCGAFEVSLLMAAGMDLDSFQPLAAKGRLDGDALALLGEARARGESDAIAKAVKARRGAKASPAAAARKSKSL